MNNINAEAVLKFLEEVKQNPLAAKKAKRLEGEWVLAEGQPQFRATVEFPGGTQVLESDFAPFMGGWGKKPDPIQYCLYGFAACYASTFAAVATMEGVILKKLRVAIENKVDLSRSLGLSKNPAVEEVQVTMTVEADASREKIEEIERLALERCPAVYCLTNPIPLKTQLVVA
jgi:uncharacterized OsmC-like protein